MNCQVLNNLAVRHRVRVAHAHPDFLGALQGGGGGETLVTEARASAAEELLFSLRSRPGPIGGGFFLPNPKVSCCCQAT